MAGLIFSICKSCGDGVIGVKKVDYCPECKKSVSNWKSHTLAHITGDFYDENSKLPSTCYLFVIKGKWFWKDKNGLENGPFETMGKARKDACIALY